MNESTWINGFLSSIGAQQTPQNVAWMQNWIAAESPWGTALYGNPLNIKDSSIGYDPANTATWLQNQGYYGPIITGLQDGDPANTPGVATALAYWSGHRGNASQLTAAYQKLVGPGAYSGGSASAVPAGVSGTGLQLGVQLTGSLFNQYASLLRVLDPFALALLVVVGLLIFGVMGWSNKFASYAAVIIFLLLMIHSSATNGATPNGTSSAAIPPASQITQPKIAYTNTVTNGGSSSNGGGDSSGLFGLGQLLGIF